MIVAIDGPSGTGKSTVAKAVAKRLKFTFFDTGAMYRSIAWWILHEKLDPKNELQIQNHLPQFDFELKVKESGERIYFVNGIDVTKEIRTPEISMIASQVSAFQSVRDTLVKIQREFASGTNAVFEGRDMGTVVFPNAEVKIFLTASIQVRAERRFLELKEKSPHLSKEQVLKEIQERDTADSTRLISPLKQAEDAILIDTSDLTVDEVVERIVTIVKRKNQMRWSYWFFLFFAKCILKIFYRIKIFGKNHVKPGAAIIAPNHASNLDPPIVAISCPEEIHFLAKESLFRVPILGRLIRHLNSHPVTRKSSDAATFRQILSLLQGGKKVLLFPEGQRTLTGELLPVERGIAFLVLKAKCRVQPVYISGTFDIWKRGRAFPKLRGKISCSFGSCIEWSEFEGLEKKEAEAKIAARIESSLVNLKSWFQNGAIGDPP